MKAPESCVEKLITERSVGNIIVKVGCGEETLLDVRRSAEGKGLTDTTLFDAPRPACGREA